MKFLKEKISSIRKARKERKMAKRMGKFRNRRSEIAYWYFIVGGVAGLVYAISCIWTGWPFLYSFMVIYLAMAFVLVKFIQGNFKAILLGLRDRRQGLLMLHMTKVTTFSQSHRMKAVQWVYPKPGAIRNERLLYLNNQIYEGRKLTMEERYELQSYKSRVTCPQQLLDGVFKAILIDSLIYAHRNIEPLDDGLRDILDLTDEHIEAFNLSREIDKCRTADAKKERDRLVQLGMNLTGQL